MVTMTTSPALPDGTQVVLREAATDADGGRAQRGATGRTAGRDSAGRYLVRLTDGRRVACRREQLALRRAFQQDLAIGAGGEADGHRLVTGHTIYAAVVGSRAFGLATDDSDTDIRGVYAAPTREFWYLTKPPPHVEGPGPETFSWKVERFCELALKANPNLLEVLHQPQVLARVGADRDRLLAVRRGEIGWAEVEAWRLALRAELDDALDRTPLPAVPDTPRVNGWLYSVRARSAREALA